MRAAKKSSPKTEKKNTALGSKPGVSGYTKKASLLEDAITQMNAGKYGRSSAALKELLALDPQNMEARRLFATLHLRLGSLLPARQAFESLANEALERQDYWLAESLLQEYLVAGPRCVPFIEKLGIVYQEKGDELAAAEEFGKAIDILLEDPNEERLDWPAQLYAKIRSLAPASSPAFRLASFFDAQSGELLTRPAAAPVELNEPTVPPTEPFATAAPEAAPSLPAMSDLMAGVMPWDRVEEETSSVLPPAHDDTDAAPSASDSSEVGLVTPTDTNSPASGESAPSTVWVEPGQSKIDSELEAESAHQKYTLEVPDTDLPAVGESAAVPASTSSSSDEPAFRMTSDSVVMDTPLSPGVGEPSSFQSDQTAESAPVPMPWDQVQEARGIISPADVGVDVETPSVAAASEAIWSYDAGDRRTSQDVEKPADSVSAPMPWEQIQDAAVIIPQAEAVSGVKTRSDSSVATESPFVALSDMVQVESQGETIPAWRSPETAASRPEALTTDLPPDASPQSLPTWEPALTGDTATLSADRLADVPPPAAGEPIPLQPIWEPVSASSANQADFPQESVSRELPPSISSPVEAQAASSNETVHQEGMSIPSSLTTEPSIVEEPASDSTPVFDSESLPENPPVPERIEKPRGGGFSWESIFSTWKYGPSSSKTKGYHAAPIDRPQTRESIPPAVDEAVPPAVHEMPAADVVPAAPPEPVASSLLKDQTSEIAATISSTEPSEPDSTEASVSAASTGSASLAVHEVSSVEAPSEPVASPIFSEQAQEMSVTIPSTEPLEGELSTSLASAPGVVVEEHIPDSSPVLDQPEDLVPPSPAITAAIEPVPVNLSPVAEFGAPFEASMVDRAAAPAPVVEPAAEIEPSLESPAQETASVPPSVEPEEFRFVFSGEATVPVSAEDVATAETRDVSNVASFSIELPVPPEESRVIEPEPVASSAQIPVAARELELTREVLSAPQTLAEPFTGGVTESPVVSPAAGMIEPMPPESESIDTPEVAAPIALAPSIEPSGTVMESVQGSSQDTDQPAHWKTGEVFVQLPQPALEAPVQVSETPPVVPPVVQETERDQAIEFVSPSQAMSAPPDPIVFEPQPLIRQEQEKEEWIRTGESIRLSDSKLVQKAERAAPSARGSEESGTSTVASAVDALFQSSGRMTPSQASERPTVATPRPKIGTTLARLRLSLSAFIGSCFSTTQALVMSLVGLVVLVGALAAIAVGAVGVTWVVMEEKPSLAFQRLTSAPEHSSLDARKNGYLLLLGFDAEAGVDPIQAGHERKPGVNEDNAGGACLGGTDGRSGGGPLNATASVAEGWFRSSNPVAQFKTKADGLKGWIGQAQSSMGRYRQWLKMSFEDWGYGQAVAPPCASILFAHRLYVAEGFAAGQPADAGVRRLQDDMEAWRMTLGQAKTLPVKMLAVQALQDDLSVASGLLAQPDVDSQALPVLSNLLRPLDQVESSMRWPMQSELAAAGPATDAQLKEERGDDGPWHAIVANWLPLPKQRRLNEYAEYYDASSKAAGEGRHSAMPKRTAYVKNPPATVLDYLSNPIENLVGLKPLPSWDRYNGMVIDVDAWLRLASVQAWLRRGSQEGDLVTRIAKAGQRFYDPYTGMPMLVNVKRGVLYSVGHDGKDQDGDPQQDVVVSIPVDQPLSHSAKTASGSVKSK